MLVEKIFIKDEDSHLYLIPKELRMLFEDTLYGSYPVNYDFFNKTFKDYRCGWDEANIPVYTVEEVKKYIEIIKQRWDEVIDGGAYDLDWDTLEYVY